MKKCFPSGKKANAGVEVLTILVVGVIFAIASIFGAQLFDELNGDIQANDEFKNETKEMVATQQGLYSSTMDNIFLMSYVFLIIFVLISSFFLDSHPIFFFITLVLLIAVFISAILVGNAYHELVSDPSISAYANTMPYMSWVMRHIAENVIGIGFMVGIALFIKHKVSF